MTGTFGPTYEPEKDAVRILKQHERVRNYMINQDWKSLPEISFATGDPEASVSAQLRHLRKPRFGSYTVDKRRRADAGLWEYRVRAAV